MMIKTVACKCAPAASLHRPAVSDYTQSSTASSSPPKCAEGQKYIIGGKAP
jgi:hypothetical protein